METRETGERIAVERIAVIMWEAREDPTGVLWGK